MIIFAKLHARLHTYDLAIKDFTEAVRLNPDFTDAYFDRGNIYGRTGNYDLAIKDYTEVLRLNPDHSGAFEFRNDACHDKREYGNWGYHGETGD